MYLEAAQIKNFNPLPLKVDVEVINPMTPEPPPMTSKLVQMMDSAIQRINHYPADKH